MTWGAVALGETPSARAAYDVTALTPLRITIVGALTFTVTGEMFLAPASMPGAMMWDWHNGMWNDGPMAG